MSNRPTPKTRSEPADVPHSAAAPDAVVESAAWRLDSAVAAGASGALWAEPKAEPEVGGTESESASHPFGVSQSTRYQPVAELGKGGMGRVVSAMDRRLQRQIAFKQVSAEVRDRPGMEQRLAREAWITAALDHPAIVPVFDAGQAPDGSLYYTMRLVRGRALTVAIHEAPGMPERLGLLRHFLAACEAVAYAHSQGILHRDLKPDNILVGEFGETQVADWGLARWIKEAESQPEVLCVSGSETTAVGAIVGTPAYMSPEQAAGLAASPRSDVFSLGVVLYEIVAGHAPLHGSDAAETLAALRNGQIPSLITKQPDAPPELVAIIDKAMAPDPAARYQDARALAADIGHYLDGSRVAAHHYTLLQVIRRLALKWRGPLLVAAVSLALLLLLAGWAVRRTRIERNVAIAAEHRTRLALAETDGLLARSLMEQALSAQSEEAQPEAEVLAAHSLTLAESPEARGVLATFSLMSRPRLMDRGSLPSCQVLRPRRDGAVLCVEFDGVSVWGELPLRKLWQQKFKAQDATWLDEGRQVVVTTDRLRAHLLDAQNGQPLGQVEGILVGPRGFAPSSQGAIALLQNVDGLSVIDAVSRSIRQLLPCGGPGSHLASTVSQSGDRVATICIDGTLVVMGADGRPLHRLPTGLVGDRSGGCALSLSNDGRLAVVVSLEGDIVVADLLRGVTKVHRRLNGGVIHGMSFSPDGQRLLLMGDRGGPILWHPSTGQVLRRLPVNGAQRAVWSADGKQLITVGTQFHRWQLPDRLSPLRFLEPRLPGLSSAELSPVGDRIALARGDGSLEVMDTRTAQLLYADRFQQGVLKGASFVQGGKEVLAWAAGVPSVRHYDSSGQVLRTFDFNRLRRAALFPSGWLVALGYGRGAHLFKLSEPGHAPLIIGNKEFHDADQSADGKTVFLIDMDGTIWEVRDQLAQPIGREFLRQPEVNTLSVSQDGSRVALATNRSVVLMDVSSRKELLRIDSPGRRILDVKLSADGRWLAAGDMDQRARVWSARDGRLLAVLQGHSGRVSGVSFSRDGSMLATASWDGSARLWGLEVLEQPAKQVFTELESSWGLQRRDMKSRSETASVPAP